MLGPGPDEGYRGVPGMRKSHNRSVIARVRHRKAHPVRTGRYFGTINSGVRFEYERRRLNPTLVRKLGQTTRAVTAHGCRRSIGIEVPHPKMMFGTRGWIQRQQAISTDTETALAESSRERSKLLISEMEEPVVDHNEVVTGPGHFGEFNDERSFHSCR